MTFKIASRVSQTSATTGTGTLSLDASSNPTGYRKFVDAIGNANTCPYVIDDGQGNVEEGIGTVTSGTPDTLARTTVINNSLGTTAKINFSAGTKTVQISPLGSRAWWWNSVPTTDQIGIANSAGGMDPISIAAYFKKLLTTDGDVAQNVGGTVQRQTMAQILDSMTAIHTRFEAYLTASATTVTGDGTFAEPTGYTVTKNIGSAFSAGVFTAPADGVLKAQGSIYLNGLTSSHTQGYCYLKRSDAVTFFASLDNIQVRRDATNQVIITFAQDVHMTAGQTVILGARVSNGTKVVNIVGGEGSTQFGGIFYKD